MAYDGHPIGNDEANYIGQALTNTFARDYSHFGWLKAHLEHYGVTNETSEDTIQDAIAREQRRLDWEYEIVCKWVMTPLDKDFYESVAESIYQQEKEKLKQAKETA